MRLAWPVSFTGLEYCTTVPRVAWTRTGSVLTVPWFEAKLDVLEDWIVYTPSGRVWLTVYPVVVVMRQQVRK